MSLDKKILNSLNKRQLSVGFFRNSNFFHNEIIRSYYDETKFFYTSEIDVPGKIIFTKRLSFSNNGKFLALGKKEGLYFLDLDKALSYSTFKNELMKFHEYKTHRLAFNKDSTQVLSSFEIEKKNYFAINDLETKKNIINWDTQTGDFCIDPFNSNIIFATSIWNLKIFDSRSSAFSIYDDNYLKNILTIQHSPIIENILLVATNNEKGVYLYDIRNKKCVFDYDLFYNKEFSIKSARFNQIGDKILVSRKSLCPSLFDIKGKSPICEFDELGFYDYSWYESCCFLGLNDEYIASSSYNWNIYIWKIPEELNMTFQNNEKLVKKVNISNNILKGYKHHAFFLKYNHKKSILASNSLNSIFLCSPFSFGSSFTCRKSEISFLKNNFSCSINILYVFVNLMYSKEERKYHNFFIEVNFDLDFQTIELEFKKNFYIKFIKSFIINNQKVAGYKQKIFKMFEEIENNFEKSNDLYVDYFFELIKIFETKDTIKNSVNFLNSLKNNLKNKMVDYLQDPDHIIKVIKSTKKVLININLLVYDLIIMYKQNMELYEVSFVFSKKMVELVANFHNNNSYVTKSKNNLLKLINDSSFSEEEELKFVNKEINFGLKLDKDEKFV